MAKIKCPNCYFTIKCDIAPWENSITCPFCKKVIPVNVDYKIVQNKSDDIVKPKRPKTNKRIIMILTYIYSLGELFILLNFAIEYRPLSGSGRYRTSLRQDIVFLMIVITSSFLLDRPFSEAVKLSKKERMNRLNEPKRTSILHYFTCMVTSIVFWYVFLGKYVLSDLTKFYAGTTKEYLIESRYLFYVTTYMASILCLYVPYLIYYGFNLNFEYLNTKHYGRIFTTINVIFVLVVMFLDIFNN